MPLNGLLKPGWVLTAATGQGQLLASNELDCLSLTGHNLEEMSHSLR